MCFSDKWVDNVYMKSAWKDAWNGNVHNSNCSAWRRLACGAGTAGAGEKAGCAGSMVVGNGWDGDGSVGNRSELGRHAGRQLVGVVDGADGWILVMVVLVLVARRGRGEECGRVGMGRHIVVG